MKERGTSNQPPIVTEISNGNDEGLRREIGLWGLSANIVNVIIGAGIFVLPAIVAASLGSASVIAYLFCGVLIALVMLCYAEAGSAITDSGGAYTYIESAFGPYAGFLTATLFLISALSADAAVANALSNVLGEFLPSFTIEWSRIFFFILIFGGLAYINVVGVKQGVGLVIFNTLAKLIPLVLLVLIGWKEVSMANLRWHSMPSISSIGEMSLLLFFAFQGGDSGLSVGGEIKNPQKTIPKAIFISIGAVLLIYILIQTISQGVLGDSLPSFRENPLAAVGQHIFGPIGLTLITIGAAFSMFGNLSGEVLNLPRVLFGAARDRVIPVKMLARVHARYATPHIAIITYAAIGLILASLGGFRQLAIMSSAALLLIYLGVALAVMKLRKRKSTASKSFRIPGGYTVPIASALIIIWFLSNLSSNERNGILILIAILTLIYLGLRYLKKRIKAT